MSISKRIISATSTALCFLMLASAAPVSAAAPVVNTKATSEYDAAMSKLGSADTSTTEYTDYLTLYKDYKSASDSIVLTPDLAKLSDGAKLDNSFGAEKNPAIIMADDSTAQFTVSVLQNALYNVNIEYMSAKEGSGDIEEQMLIDSKQPFSELTLISLPRTYTQNNKFESNLSGNEIKPDVTEVFKLSNYTIKDSSGYVDGPYKFALSKGNHIITFKGSRGSAGITKITFSPIQSLDTYKDYIKKYDSIGAKDATADTITIEAEKLTYKNSLTVFPSTDRTSSATTPQSPKSLLLNSIGGDNYKYVGESISWEIDVKSDGYYEITPRFKQSYSDGVFTEREVKIDGNVPFSEAAQIKFNYDSQWQQKALGDGVNAYKFYLSAGKHLITFEVTMGSLSETIGKVKSSLTKMNTIYRKIITITGTSPDTYRDYGFDSLIPNEIKQMAQIKDDLQNIVDYVDEQTGSHGSYTSTIQKIIFQLEKMSEKSSAIAKYLEQFKANLGSLGTWLLDAQQQPLLLDKLYVAPATNKLPDSNGGFFDGLSFSFQSFIYSFVTDYSSIGSSNKDATTKSIKVWIQTGRDQAEILRNLIDTDFAKKYNANVKLELVAAGSLLPSILSGTAPDVCLNNLITEPINYAVRNSVVNLRQFDDYNDVSGWFHESAIKPFTFMGKTYALPETFTFNMFFYRTDIFDQLKLTPPNTWQDMLDLVGLLQTQNLEVGMPHDINAYSMILYQNGGHLYNKEGETTNIGSNEGLNSFLELTELFTLYDMPTYFDFANRFRSGEMPCAVQDYSMYNQLIAFAPEIKGNWKMIPVPGKVGADGKVHHTSVGTGSAAMILKGTKELDLSWNFLKWWLSADTQSTFAVDMESLLGPAAKYTTANIEALKKMTWSREEYTNILAQMNEVEAVDQVPGSYYLPRILQFAFNRVYNVSGTQNMAENPVEVISEYIPELNKELTRKREELLSGIKE